MAFSMTQSIHMAKCDVNGMRYTAFSAQHKSFQKCLTTETSKYHTNSIAARATAAGMHRKWYRCNGGNWKI
jgi:hypothetical protein